MCTNRQVVRFLESLWATVQARGDAQAIRRVVAIVEAHAPADVTVTPPSRKLTPYKVDHREAQTVVRDALLGWGL